jgi:hypothetical protein
MDPKGQALLKLLFNEGEAVCVSKNKFGFHSIPLENALSGQVTLVSPNEKVPISYCDSSELTLVAINPIKGFRLDSNVTSFRTFLWEIDTGSIPKQLGYFEKIGIPLSCTIWSGNKSVHALTVLDQDLDEKKYREYYQWALNVLTWCDQNCKNPSRSTRIPGAYREPGKKQRLIDMRERVKLSTFEAWLNQYEHLRPKVREKKEIPEGGADYSLLSVWVRIMMKKGIDFANRGRNATYYAIAYDFALAGFSIETATEELLKRFTEERDFKEKELLVTINSAFKKVNEDKA